MEPAPAIAPRPSERTNAPIQDAILSDRFPVSFRLAEDEVTSTSTGGLVAQPLPYMCHLSRQSYLPLVFEKLREHFADRCVAPRSGAVAEPWIADLT